MGTRDVEGSIPTSQKQLRSTPPGKRLLWFPGFICEPNLLVPSECHGMDDQTSEHPNAKSLYIYTEQQQLIDVLIRSHLLEELLGALQYLTPRLLHLRPHRSSTKTARASSMQEHGNEGSSPLQASM